MPSRKPFSPENLPGLQREEEERSVVGDRRDVVGIAARKGVGIVARDQIGERILPGLRRQIERVEFRVVIEMRDHRRLFRRSERSFLGQHDDRDAVCIELALRGDDEIAGGIGHAQAMQRFHGHRDHAQSFARMAEFPAGDGDHSVGLEVIEIFAERLDGIEIVFAEGERAGGGRGPGVDQRHLHDIKMLRSRAQKRAAIGDVDMHVGPIVEMLRVVGVPLAHDGGGDDGIDLDPGHARAAVGHGAQNVDAAARADDGELSVRAENVGQCGRRGHQIVLPHGALPVREIGVHDVGGSVGVDDDRLGLALAVDFHARERIPARELHPRGIAEHALRVHHVDEASGVVRADQRRPERARAERHFCAANGTQPRWCRPRPWSLRRPE